MNLKRLIYGAAFALGGLLAGSCAHRDDPDGPDPALPEGSVYLTLHVRALDDAPPSSAKAPVYEENDTNKFQLPATEYEKIHTLRVILVHPDGKVEENRRIMIPSNGIAIDYSDLTFTVKGGEKKKVYLFANEGAVDYDFNAILKDAPFPTNEVENITLSTNADGILIDNSGDTKTYIPMSEVFEVNITDKELYQTASLFVTRAAVKFSFEVKGKPDLPESSSLYVSSVSITGMSDREYLLPRNTVYKPAKYEKSSYTFGGRFITSYETPAETVLNPYTFSMVKTDLPVRPSENKTYTPYIYFPESSDTSYDVTIDFQGGSVLLPDFKETVTLPNLPSLPRNTHVKIVITMTKPTEVAMEVTVLPYSSVILTPEFGL